MGELMISGRFDVIRTAQGYKGTWAMPWRGNDYGATILTPPETTANQPAADQVAELMMRQMILSMSLVMNEGVNRELELLKVIKILLEQAR